MRSETENEQALALRLESMREELNLLQRLLSKPEEPSEKRTVLLGHCAKQSVDEREVWWNLAAFRESGAEGLLYECLPDCLFDSVDQTLRKEIVAGIAKIPLETLEDFRQLITFTFWFLGRMQFLCNFLLYLFLQREKGSYRESLQMSYYTEFFVAKMIQEVERIDQITNIHLFSDLNDMYEQWLGEKVADEELLI